MAGIKIENDGLLTLFLNSIPVSKYLWQPLVVDVKNIKNK